MRQEGESLETSAASRDPRPKKRAHAVKGGDGLSNPPAERGRPADGGQARSAPGPAAAPMTPTGGAPLAPEAEPGGLSMIRVGSQVVGPRGALVLFVAGLLAASLAVVGARNETPALGRAGGGVGTAGVGAGGAVGLRKGLTVKVESVSGSQLVVKTVAGSTVPGVTKTVLAGSAELSRNGRAASISAIKAGQTLLLKGGSRDSAGDIVPSTITIEH